LGHSFILNLNFKAACLSASISAMLAYVAGVDLRTRGKSCAADMMVQAAASWKYFYG
jgi:hypothetical protein